MSYSHQDWSQVVFRSKEHNNGKDIKDDKIVRRAMQNGNLVETHEKVSKDFVNKKIIDDNPDDFHHKMISKNIADAIKKKRIEMKLTQAQLAQRINEKVNIIQDIEGMKCVYNHIIINKTLKALGLSLKQISKN
jgi:putative transcription factor